MALAVGARLGPYETLGVLGQGGMGVVYRARDVNLDRDVALKVLPEALVADPDRLARFRREARVLASLNHPNIAAIYGFEEADGVRALVLEIVEGQTLADRLVQGALPTRDALSVARQIAEALEAAHEQGVIHRDLKPGNIKVRPDGSVKVLDFGLAKIARPATLVPTAPPVGNAAITELGAVMGTAAYMPPEQARGQDVDRRADIWAFGCVTYEMLTGARAFPGDTFTDVILAVVENEPDWDALPPDTPVSIRLLLRRCMRSDVARRLQHIGDARIELQDALAGPDGAALPESVPRRAPFRRAAPWTVAAVAVGLAIASALWGSRSPAPTQRQVSRLELNLPTGVDLDASVGQSTALSPDGTQVAFVGVAGGLRQIYLRSLDQFEAIPLRGTEQATSCFFSPDGRNIAFMAAAGTLKALSLADGIVSTLASEVNWTAGGAWGPDDLITFARQGTLWQVPASGGAARQLTTLDTAKNELSHAWPSVIAGGRALLFASNTADDPGTARIEVFSFTDRRRHVVVDAGTFPLYAPSGHLIYFRDGVLFAASFDAERLEVTGAPVRVIENLAATAGVPLAALSSTGSLAFAPNAGGANRLVWVSRQGEEQTINDAPRAYRHPRLSPDGSRLVVQASGDLWTQDLARGTFARLTSLGTVDGYIAWMPDAAHVVFRTTTDIRIIEANGGGRTEVVSGTSAVDYPNSVSPDGQTLAFVKLAATGDLYSLSLRGEPKQVAMLRTGSYEAGAQFSPDGRWLAYVSDESGQLQVYVQPFPALNRKWQVSTDGGTQVLWNRNGRELFYRNGNKMVAVDVTTSPEFALSPPRVLFERRYATATVTFANYDAALDGEHFVMVRDESGSGRLDVVLNWSDELEHLRPRLDRGRAEP